MNTWNKRNKLVVAFLLVLLIGGLALLSHLLYFDDDPVELLKFFAWSALRGTIFVGIFLVIKRVAKKRYDRRDRA